MSDFDLFDREIEDLYRPVEKKKPMVVLTVEEAKILLECACCVDAYTFAKCKKLFNCLERRIEQAEKAHE